MNKTDQFLLVGILVITSHYAEEQEQGWKKLPIDESYTKLKFSKAPQQKWQI